MRRKTAKNLETSLRGIDDFLLTVGGAALGTYLVMKFFDRYKKRDMREGYAGYGDADLGLMPYHRR